MSVIFYLYCLDFPNGKKYIGLTKDPARRARDHRSKTSSGAKLPVCCAIRKYGLPRMRMLCAGEQDYIINLEIRTIELWGTRDRKFGYNIAFGGKLSPAKTSEVRDKISRTLMGHPVSEATRAKLAGVLTGRLNPHSGTPWSAKTRANHVGRHNAPKPPEVRAKISASKKGQSNGRVGCKLSPETRAKLSVAGLAHQAHRRAIAPPKSPKAPPVSRKGVPLSAETRAKLKAAATGRPNPLNRRPSPFKGIRRSLEVGQRISAAKKGRSNGRRGYRKQGGVLKPKAEASE